MQGAWVGGISVFGTRVEGVRRRGNGIGVIWDRFWVKERVTLGKVASRAVNLGR